LFRFDTDSGKVTCLLESPEIETSPAVSPDGATVVFSRRVQEADPAHLWTMDLATGEVRQLTDASASDVCAAFSPIGDYVYFARSPGLRNYSMGGKVWTDFDIFRLRVRTGTVEKVTNNRFFRSVNGIALSPDGKLVFGVQYDPSASADKLYAIDVKGLVAPITVAPQARVLNLGAANSWETGAAFSPDGSMLAFVSDAREPFAYNAWTSGPNGENPKPLTVDRRHIESPRFFRGGKSLVFLSEESSPNPLNSGNAEMSIMELDLETGEVKQLTR
jgi:Tol biopolymer transport system component